MVRIPALARNVFLLHNFQTGAGIHLPSYPKFTKALSPGVKVDGE
jgi:hypothetical protein